MFPQVRSTGEVVRLLRSQGQANATVDRLNHAIRTGYIKRPEQGPCNLFFWTESHIEEARAYLRAVPPRGRRVRQEAAS